MSDLEFALWQRYYAAEDEIRSVMATSRIVKGREEAARYIIQKDAAQERARKAKEDASRG